MLKAVFFDLDGTLLPMDDKEFTKGYFYMLYEKVKHLGYEDMKELISVINDGTVAMYKNDGKETNEKVFWKLFEGHYGKKVYEHMPVFDDFYSNEFKKTKAFCGENKLAKDIVKYAKENVGLVVLSTNPVFPLVGTKTRIEFIDMKPEDFDFITSYENSSYSKPNPQYFIWLMEKFNLKPDEVILFGNNDYEDYACAKKAGIDCYLAGETLIIHDELKLNPPIIKMDDVIKTIEFEIDRRK